VDGKLNDFSAQDSSLEILDCRYGKMLAFRADDVIGRSLRLYGEWSQHELSYLRPFVVPGRDVVDVGANIGTHTLAFAQWVGSGRVIAIEPQPFVASVLEVNCALNELRNVEVVKAACGSRTARAAYSLDKTNVGATTLDSQKWWKNILLALFRVRREETSHVPVHPLDDMLTDRPVSFIKIDVEGMELDVVNGAIQVLKKWHPVVYFEQNDTKQLAQISAILEGLGYRLYWLETHQFNQDNFRRETENIWWRTETGVLALYDLSKARPDLTEVRNGYDKVPTRLDARKGVVVPPVPS
jgi:FkbM family methyltransferase